MIFFRIVILACIPVIVRSILNKMSKEENYKKSKSNYIYYDKIIRLIISFGWILIVFLAYQLATKEKEYLISVLIIVYSIPILIMAIKVNFITIIANDNYFIYKSFLKKGKKIYYNDIDYVKENNYKYRLYTNNISILITKDMVNSNIIYSKISKKKKQYKKIFF